jgi:hypothetical protein
MENVPEARKVCWIEYKCLFLSKKASVFQIVFVFSSAKANSFVFAGDKSKTICKTLV